MMLAAQYSINRGLRDTLYLRQPTSKANEHFAVRQMTAANGQCPGEHGRVSIKRHEYCTATFWALSSSALGPGCVKSRKFNLRLELSSRLRRFDNRTVPTA